MIVSMPERLKSGEYELGDWKTILALVKGMGADKDIIKLNSLV